MQFNATKYKPCILIQFVQSCNCPHFFFMVLVLKIINGTKSVELMTLQNYNIIL